MKRVDVFLRRVAALLPREIEADDSTLAKIHCQFCHLERNLHIPHGADKQTGFDAEISSSATESLEHGCNHLLVGQSLARVENRREARLEVNHPIATEILRLLEGCPLQRFFGLQNGDRVRETAQVFGKASLIRIVMKPRSQFFSIVAREFGVTYRAREFDNRLWAKTSVQMLVQKDLWQRLEQRSREFHDRSMEKVDHILHRASRAIAVGSSIDFRAAQD
jgi:hypothetical protein